MVAIEKTCEYSDTYTGPDMYRHKRNHIQIEPRYRKNFRGVDCTLKIEKSGWVSVVNSSGIGTLHMCYEDMWEEYNREYEDVPKNRKVFEAWLKYLFQKRIKEEISYNLVVNDPNWKCPTGRKSFLEFTYDKPGRVIKRIRRMVGPKLKVVVA